MMQHLAAATRAAQPPATALGRCGMGTSCGKMILAGEHGVVYGKRALAVPVPGAARAFVIKRGDKAQTVCVPNWGIPEPVALQSAPQLLQAFLAAAVDPLILQDAGWDLHVDVRVPRGSGLGGSAAIAVAAIRAWSQAFGLGLTDEGVNNIAFACERVAHGAPSGIDNAVAAFARPILFRKAPPLLQILDAPKKALHWVVGFTGEPGLTSVMVEQVHHARLADAVRVDALLEAMDACAVAGHAAFADGDACTLGHVMDEGHALLVRLGVSSPKLDDMVSMARAHGALGAKLTGAGGGGAMIALVDEANEGVRHAFEDAGLTSYTTVTC